MSSHTSMHGEIREQHQKTKDMSFRGKLDYFWYYYKIHTLVVIAVIALAVSLIHSFVTNKDYAFYAVLINVDHSRISDNQWGEEFTEYAGIDTEEYQVYMDTSMTISNLDYSTSSYANIEKLMAMIYSGTIDVIVTDTGSFESYAQNEYFLNLETILPEKTLEKYQDYLYYTDAASFDTGMDDALSDEDGQKNSDTIVINHRDPSAMEQPVPVGICLPEGNKIIETGCFDYLNANNMTFQGYPSEAVLGIVATTEHMDTVLKFLDFLEE